MYAFLLILGAAITAAGILLVAPGVPIQGRVFDASIITPGAVAVVGGLILIGLGLAVRVLGRIERALAARPMPRTARPDEAAVGASATERPNTLARIPFPPKPTAESRPQPAPPDTAGPPAPAEDKALQRLREKFPTLVQLENAPVVEETDISLLPKPPIRADEDVAEVNRAVASRQANGTAPARTAPRLEVHARPSSRPERSKSFDAFWPKRQRPGREAQTTPARPAAPALPVEPTQGSEPASERYPAASAPEAPTPVSILKSGVVDGMAYTLYSDGSIEAQLPQGTLRFGSITELRNHIEQSA
jgi:hypothetical protein